MRIYFLLLWWQGLVFVSWAAVPPGYYSSIEGKREAELKAALSNLLENHSVLEYDSLWFYFTLTDTREDGTVWDMYSDRHQAGFQGMNREHAFPKSWWGGHINAAYSDLHHLFPADGEANRAKNNHPLGVVGIPVFNNGVSKVGYARNDDGITEQLVFEPSDAYKGDFARVYFYMVTCYQSLTWRYTFMVETNTYPTLKPEAIRLLLEWHRNDPVCVKEKQRNEVVYELQRNRNPFVDYPELAYYIWGDSTQYTFSLQGREGSGLFHSALQIWTGQGSIYIQSTKQDQQLEVFAVTGYRMAVATTTGTTQCLGPFPPGMYLIRCSGMVCKVVVR